MTTADMYKEYQKNIRHTEATRVRIMKGMSENVPASTMFVWRCYRLYCCTGDKLIYEKAKEYVKNDKRNN